MQEIWKDIKDYEGLYQISNLGRVKSLPKIRKANHDYISKEKYLKFGGKRYNIVVLYKNKKAKTFTVHKLVALHFIDNPENKSCVNHKDGNKLNNNVHNLEWCSISENTKHAYDNGLKISVNRYTKK